MTQQLTPMSATPDPDLDSNRVRVGAAGQLRPPAYDRDALAPAVVHIGFGSFHRAHQAVYFDDLARSGCADWGVVGVGVRRPELGRVLEAQGNLFTVVQRDGLVSSARVVGCVVEYLLLADRPGDVVQRLADPRAKLVTLTITADGYDTRSVECAAIFGALAAALAGRRAAGVAPFTVLSCDNTPDPQAARRATLWAAQRRDPALAEWVERHVRFPVSMVDRITPQTSLDERDRIALEFDVLDRWPVLTEPFAQWVIEDAFCNDRPPLDSVGVRFVDDVAPYKLIKTRMLNGVHTAVAYLGYLAGARRTNQAMADIALRRFANVLMRDEIAPALPGDVRGMRLKGYRKQVLIRLANPEIGDELARLCARGSRKMPDYVLPSLHSARAERRRAPLCTLAVAAWIRYLGGTDLDGRPIQIDDPLLDELQPLARGGATGIRTLLSRDELFGGLGADAEFVEAVQRYVELIDLRGVRTAISFATDGG
ncbi:mannitol dehydrogenase family protein [uncultured Jatrophihabitans sp.]|uniref:mannitol dehydrogenase family protein n=1 Tax=uncultured Jatrophihabitans sp. TaxID=1610747 RepID=UPI0035C94851